MKAIQRLLPVAMGLLLAVCAPAFSQQDPPLPKCCIDIFNTGYALGGAFVLAEEKWLSESLLNSLIDMLNDAANYVEAAHGACSAVNPAWPTWKTKQNELRRWADWLKTHHDESTLRSVAAYLQDARRSYGEELMVQIVLSRRERRATCEAYYFDLGYNLHQARGCLIFASSPAIARTDRMDYNTEAQAAFDRIRNDLDYLLKVYPVTGGCAPIEPLRPRFSEWQANYDDLERAGRNEQLLSEIFIEVQKILTTYCGYSMAGGSGGGATIASVIGRWTSLGQEYDAATGRWTTATTDSLELYGTRGSNGYETNDDSFWGLKDGKLWIGGPDSRSRMVFTLQPNGTWIGSVYDENGTLLFERNKRIVLRRADR